MELVGHEKRIQELFGELRLEDERLTPGFARVLSRAQAKSAQPWRGLRLSFAVVTALLVVSLLSLAIWQRSQQPNATVAGGSSNPTVNPTPKSESPEPKQPGVFQPSQRPKLNARARRLAALHRAELIARDAAIRKAAVISSWQSPTTTLLQSPADDVLTSLPQLNQPVYELKSFLPNTPK